MEHNKFSIVITGRYNKNINIVLLAKRVSEHFNITTTEAIKIIKTRESYTLHKSMEHVKAYQIKRVLQDSGAEIKLEPAKIYYNLQPKKQEKTQIAKKNKKVFFKKISLFNKKEKKRKKFEINWEEKPTYKTYTSIQVKSTKNSFSNILLIILFTGGFWYLYNSNFASTGAFDEVGNPIVILFTSSQCGTACNDVVRDLNFRRAPFVHLNINPANTEDEDVKLWRSFGKSALPLTASGNEVVVGNSKPNMATLLGLNFGSKYLTSIEKSLYHSHFNQDGTAAIVVYGAQWCNYCNRLKKQLKSEDIPFQYIDAEKNIVLAKNLNIYGYPAVWIGYNRLKKTKFSHVKSAYNNI